MHSAPDPQPRGAISEDGELDRLRRRVAALEGENVALRESLRAADGRLSVLAEGIGDAFYALDREWRFTAFNRGAEQYFQRPRDAVLGRVIWELFPWAVGSGLYDRMLEAMARRVPMDFEADSVAVPGHRVEFHLFPIDDGLGLAFRDWTIRWRAEAALRESEERLDLAVQAHGIGIFDCDLPSGGLVLSDQEQRLFGLEPGTFEGTVLGWARRVVPEDRKRVQAQIADSIARGESSLDLGFRVQLPDGSLRELEGSGRLLYGEDGSALRLVGVHIDATGRKRSEERQRLLLHELNHRVKNTLATVQSIAMQTFRGGAAEARATETFVARLIALSKTHDVLTRENWESADLLAVVSETLAPHCGDGARFEIEGRSLRVPPRLALSLAMALHELCTNAAKYGALSSPGGRVSLRWSAAGRGRTRRLRLAWQESGGPPVVPPERRGFGSRLIETGLARELGGEVRLAFEAPGVACDITVPLAAEAAG